MGGRIMEIQQTKLKLEGFEIPNEERWIDYTKVALFESQKYQNESHEHIGCVEERNHFLTSFAVSSTNCVINGYAEHWMLNCEVCESAKELLKYKDSNQD